jgi:hypothetical protein
MWMSSCDIYHKTQNTSFFSKENYERCEASKHKILVKQHSTLILNWGILDDKKLTFFKLQIFTSLLNCQCPTLMCHIRIMYFFCILKVALVANFTSKGKEDNNTMQSHNIFYTFFPSTFNKTMMLWRLSWWLLAKSLKPTINLLNTLNLHENTIGYKGGQEVKSLTNILDYFLFWVKYMYEQRFFLVSCTWVG